MDGFWFQSVQRSRGIDEPVAIGVVVSGSALTQMIFKRLPDSK